MARSTYSFVPFLSTVHRITSGSRLSCWSISLIIPGDVSNCIRKWLPSAHPQITVHLGSLRRSGGHKRQGSMLRATHSPLVWNCCCRRTRFGSVLPMPRLLMSRTTPPLLCICFARPSISCRKLTWDQRVSIRSDTVSRDGAARTRMVYSKIWTHRRGRVVGGDAE